MTPQDKAIDLYTYYEDLIKDFTKGVSIKELAKECASKAIIETLEVLVINIDKNQSIIEYYQEVKQEINKI